MTEKKRFKKSNIDSNDHKAMEVATKVVKGIGSTVAAISVIVLNKENIKTAAKTITDVVKKM